MTEPTWAERQAEIDRQIESGCADLREGENRMNNQIEQQRRERENPQEREAE